MVYLPSGAALPCLRLRVAMHGHVARTLVLGPEMVILKLKNRTRLLTPSLKTYVWDIQNA
jgi:hypothetical protein